eukprot:COSAG01_NODE_7510_length_3175_cov_7.716607_1_plen_56_part_00
MWRRLVVGEQVGRAEAERDESAAQLELSRCAVIYHHGHTHAVVPTMIDASTGLSP